MANKQTKNHDSSAKWLRDKPISHRGLHDKSAGIYENSLSAAQASMKAGFPIELDLQISSDGVPMVFHDYSLERLTGQTGQIRETPLSELKKLNLGTSSDTIPTLREFLELIQGAVGIVLEFKGLPGKDDGFVAAAAQELEHYKGDFALMSFHHHILEDAREVCPHFATGLTAEGGDEAYEQHMTSVRNTAPDFISYNVKELDTRFVREFVGLGKPSICWTVRSEEQAKLSANYVDQITFEGFLPQQ